MTHFELTLQNSSFSRMQNFHHQCEQAEITSQKFQFVNQIQQNSPENKQLFEALLDDDQNDLLFTPNSRTYSFNSLSSQDQVENITLVGASKPDVSCVIHLKRKRILKQRQTLPNKKEMESKKVSQKETVKRPSRKTLRKQVSTVQQNFYFLNGIQTTLFSKQSEHEKTVISQIVFEKGKDRELFDVFGLSAQGQVGQDFSSYLSLD